MAYMIIRGSQDYVSMVDKGRVNGSVQTKKYVCGLGKMSYEDFKAFQAWAHSLKPQEYRKAQVLSSPIAIAEKERLTKLDIKPQTAPKKKVIGKVKGNKTPTKTKKSKGVHNMPVQSLAGYKGRDRDKTHTSVMMERRKDKADEKEMRRLKALKDQGVDISEQVTPKVSKELSSEDQAIKDAHTKRIAKADKERYERRHAQILSDRAVVKGYR